MQVPISTTNLDHDPVHRLGESATQPIAPSCDALAAMAWGLDGFHTVMLRHGSFADLLPSLLPLLAFAIFSLALAAWLNQRSLAARS